MILLKIWRWIIKKNFDVIILAVSICVVFTKALFSTYSNEQEMMLEGNIYFLQYAVFTQKDVIDDVTKKLDNYFLIEDDNKYYIYLGAYNTLANAHKMKKIFEDDKIYTYIKNDYISDEKKMDIKKLNEEIKNENNLLKLKEINNKIINIFKE